MKNQNLKTNEEKAVNLYIRHKSPEIKTAYLVTLATGTVEAKPATLAAKKVAMQDMEEAGLRTVKTGSDTVETELIPNL